MNAATTYLQSYEHYFWQYEDRGKVIAVPNGHTLGYSDLVLGEILIFLAPSGLPRFGSLLLTLAATNAHGTDTLNDIMRLVDRHVPRTTEIDQAVEFIGSLTKLPAEFKKGNRRLELLRAIFDDSHNRIGLKESQSILAELKRESKIEAYPGATRPAILSEQQFRSQIKHDFKTLSVIAKRLDTVDAIINSVTGLPQLGEELADLETSFQKKEHEADFIEKLHDNYTTFYVGALVPRLISGLNIPMRSSLRSEQPLGGVADITNKGQVDKLLISEFANDDDVLMSRLANSEALYHHREAPPADNDYSRIILIDVTMKNWGTIKTISFATMLAIVNHPKHQNPCRVFVVGSSYHEISVGTVHDIIEAMHALDSSLDPGVGLFELFTKEAIEVSEIFYIGSSDALEYSTMQLFNAEFGKRIDHWIHPDENGQLSVYENPKRGKRFIQNLQLPLEKLWKNNKRQKSDIVVYDDARYPILFPENKVKTSWEGERFTYAVTKYRALLRRYADYKDMVSGCEIITTKFLPQDVLLAVITHHDLTCSALVKDSNKDFCIIDFPSHKRTALADFRHLKNIRFFSVEGDCFIGKMGTWEHIIDLKGNVTRVQVPFAVESHPKFQSHALNVYRNIKFIGITNERTLRIGKQDLCIHANNLKLMHQGKELAFLETAEQDATGLFRFADGSTILHNPNGMLTFMSSNKQHAPFYIPPVLNTPIAASTEDVFTGNLFYRMNFKIELSFTGGENELVSITQIIKSRLPQLSLRKAKQMAEAGYVVGSDETDMMELKKDLIQIGLSCFLRNRGLKQEYISPFNFYNKYINTFINTILQ